MKHMLHCPTHSRLRIRLTTLSTLTFPAIMGKKRSTNIIGTTSTAATKTAESKA